MCIDARGLRQERRWEFQDGGSADGTIECVALNRLALGCEIDSAVGTTEGSVFEPMLV